ncbi:MAG: hypothetical protein LBV60_23850 [Streptomyces sp.]|jgi:hypothetical protein|nr:hypothetical protein [Streptomyces sp.]
MTTITAPVASPPKAPPVLDLDARMALRLAEMDERCTLAVLAVDVNTAHISAADPLPEITAPLPLTPTTTPCPYQTPIAAVLHRARTRLQTDGWTRDTLVDEQGRRCPIGAIRVEASSRWQADDACVLLLEAIRRDVAAETIPSWNAAQPGIAPVLLAFDRAAELAHARDL